MNVVVLLVDTLRYDYSHLIPAFSEGMVFERMYSPSTFTYPVLCSLRSGLYPVHHGWRTWPEGGPFKAATTLEECLTYGGYNIHHTLEVPPSSETRYIRRPKETPYFTFCWYMGIHDRIFSSAVPPKGVIGRKYKSSVLYAADWVERAIQKFDGDMILLFGDHGIGLAGDKLLKEGQDVGAGQVYDFRVRVPCTLIGPRILPCKIKEAYSLVDLMPTILYLLGFPVPHALDGFVVGKRNEPVLLEAQSPFSIWPSKVPNVFGATDGKFKVMITPDGNLCFDLENDPGEKEHRKDLLRGPAQYLWDYVKEGLL